MGRARSVSDPDRDRAGVSRHSRGVDGGGARLRRRGRFRFRAGVAGAQAGGAVGDRTMTRLALTLFLLLCAAWWCWLQICEVRYQRAVLKERGELPRPPFVVRVMFRRRQRSNLLPFERNAS